MEMDDHTSELIDISRYDTHGFCPGYTLRRHKAETLANAGCYEARKDWIQYIGPVEEFGNCNPVNGNFTAVVLPLTKPERLRLVAYILEYAFLHDNVVEVTKDDASTTTAFSLGDMETSHQNAKLGRKQIQAKMMLQLTQTDPVCAKRVLDVWQTMLETTTKDKSKSFANVEEYLEFRIIDAGAPFVESVMLFGMGETLTKEKDALLAPIIRPCYASLALANDYFSFDREWAESLSSPDAPKPLNAVWLYMQWQSVDMATAKWLVREATNQFEVEFLEGCRKFRESSGKSNDRLERYLRGLQYQVSGNVVWSLNCPRYHPDWRYEANEGLEDGLTVEWRGSPLLHVAAAAEQVEDVSVSDLMEATAKRLSITSWGSRESESDVSTTSSLWEDRAASSRSSSVSAMPSDDERHDGMEEFKNAEREKESLDSLVPREEKLGMEIVNAPFEYTRSLPSKNVRATFIDALNLWAGLPEEVLVQIKEVVDDLQTASLMFDDVEDGSELRRGNPAAHAVFGVPQTINAASLAIVEAVRKAKGLPIPGAVDIALEQLRDLHVGQSYDLYWTRHMSCPSESEYLEMVAKKTGGLFLLLSRLMSEHMPKEVRSLVNHLVTQVGIYFQIRDDYHNISSDEYTAQKGFCEDLDEGKLSFTLVHYLNTEGQSSSSQQVREVLQERQQRGSLSMPLKLLTLQRLKSSNSLEYTRDTLKRLERGVDRTIEELERLTGRKNWVLRMCMAKLSV